MMIRTAGLAVLASALLGLSPRVARADVPASCSRISVEADSSIDARWPELAGRVRDAFEARVDVDRCARVHLTSREGTIGIDVALPDGRSARRLVARQEDVVSAVEALLIVPPDPSPSRAPSATVASAPEALPPAPRKTEIRAPSPAITSERAREAPPVPPAAQPPPGHLRIELSVLTAARIGDGRASIGAGAVSFLELSRWLLGFAGRADRYRLDTGADSGGAFELAVLGGRRFWLESAALDLFGGAAAALQGTTTVQMTAPASAGAPCMAQPGGACVNTTSSSSTVPRLVLGARLSFSARSVLHTFMGIDGDFGPARAGDPADTPTAPRLPIWTLGLALGATVGTP